MFKYDDFNKRAFAEIPLEATILDVGCSTGKLGQRIRKEKKPKKLYGIEKDKKAAEVAKKYYDQVVVIDLDEGGIEKLPFSVSFFDCIILADVLEHLKSPEILLFGLKKYLRKDGRLIISLPNFLFILNRVAILTGNFKYRDKGIMDRTHLRFFTIQSAKDLIIGCGYKVDLIRGYINTRPTLSFLDVFAKFWPNIASYQILIMASQK